jgi:hypothetical protein
VTSLTERDLAAQSALDAQLVGLVRRACDIGEEQRCHGSFRCGLAASMCASPPPPPPVQAAQAQQPLAEGATPAAAAARAEAQDVVVMGRLFVFDRALCFRATHSYALVRAPFTPRIYKFDLTGRDVADVLPCAVASAPSAALALCLRPTGDDHGDEEDTSASGSLACAVLQEFSSYDEDDNRFFRNAAWEQCFDRLLDVATERAAAAAAAAAKPAAAAAAPRPAALASEE